MSRFWWLLQNLMVPSHQWADSKVRIHQMMSFKMIKILRGLMALWDESFVYLFNENNSTSSISQREFSTEHDMHVVVTHEGITSLHKCSWFRITGTRNASVINYLTHWGRVMHICISKLTIIGSDNGLSPGQRQAIIWTNVGILLTGPLETNFSEIFIAIYTFSFKKMHLKMSSGDGGHFVSASTPEMLHWKTN